MSIQSIIDQENSIFKGHSDYASQEVLDRIARDVADPRKRERKPPAKAVEFAQQQKEMADEAVEGYKFDGQEQLLDEKSRLVNFMSVKDFMLKLQETGLPFFLTDSNYPKMLGLWLGFADSVPDRQRFVCSIQQPWMSEWSVLRLDHHNLPVNWRYKGWRTVLLQLVRLNILTEVQINKVFGPAQMGTNSLLYRKQMHELRNGGLKWEK